MRIGIRFCFIVSAVSTDLSAHAASARSVEGAQYNGRRCAVEAAVVVKGAPAGDSIEGVA